MMQKIVVILSLALVLVANSAFGRHICQISGSEPTASGAEAKTYRVCPAFPETLKGLLVLVECDFDCGLDNGYYLSRDHGSTWTRVSAPDEGDPNVRATFKDVRIQDKVLYRTVASGHGDKKQWLLERSNDYGRSWIKAKAIWAGTGLEIKWFVDLYYDSSNPELIYATTSLPGSVGIKWLLFISKDGGDKFELLAGDVHDFAVSRTNPDVIYAITFAGNIIKTINKGQNWSDLGDVSLARERRGKDMNATLLSIRVDPSNLNRVFVLSGNGLYHSDDGGLTWHRVDPDAGEQIETCNFVIDPGDPRRMFLGTYDKGIFKSEDGGYNWEAVDLTAKTKR